MSDTDAINAIVQLLEDTVTLITRYDPMFADVPGVSDLLIQVNNLKMQRQPQTPPAPPTTGL